MSRRGYCPTPKHSVIGRNSDGHARARVWKDGDDAIKIDGVNANILTNFAFFTSITIQVPRVTLFRKGLMGLEEALAAKGAADAAQATADGKAPKTTYEFQIAPAPQAPSAPAAGIFIPPTDPIAPQGALDERVPVTFTFRTADGDVDGGDIGLHLRSSATAAAPVVLADPDDDTKEFMQSGSSARHRWAGIIGMPMIRRLPITAFFSCGHVHLAADAGRDQHSAGFG